MLPVPSFYSVTGVIGKFNIFNFIFDGSLTSHVSSQLINLSISVVITNQHIQSDDTNGHRQFENHF